MRQMDPLPLFDSPYPQSIIDNELPVVDDRSEASNEEEEEEIPKETPEEREQSLEQEQPGQIRVEEDLHPIRVYSPLIENRERGYYHRHKGIKFKNTHFE